MKLNQQVIDKKTGEYKPEKVAMISMVAGKVDTIGIGPCERHLHSAVVFQEYLCVFGGRNDSLYSKQMQTVALNDLHLLNLKNRNWMTLAIFGEELPQ